MVGQVEGGHGSAEAFAEILAAERSKVVWPGDIRPVRPAGDTLLSVVESGP